MPHTPETDAEELALRERVAVKLVEWSEPGTRAYPGPPTLSELCAPMLEWLDGYCTSAHCIWGFGKNDDGNWHFWWHHAEWPRKYGKYSSEDSPALALAMAVDALEVEA